MRGTMWRQSQPKRCSICGQTPCPHAVPVEPTPEQIEAAFEEHIRRPFLNRCEPVPYTFSKTPTGFYCSPHLRDRLTDFAAGYTAMYEARPNRDDVK